MKESIIIFGASTAGKACYELLKDRYRIKYFCDNDKSKQGKFINGVEVISSECLQLVENQYDKIIIASSYYKEIREQLSILKIDKPIEIMRVKLEKDELVLDYSKDNDEFTKFINGEKLSNGLKIRYSRIARYRSRNDVIKEIISEKKVIDLGCTDHLELIDFKISNGTWLHSIVSSFTEKCIGIDINRETVDYVVKLGYNDVKYADIIEDYIEEIGNDKWDYLLMADILEHINNPVTFLKSIKDKYKDNISQYIISVPNAFSRQNLELVKRNIEFINTDHRYWFTPFTITKVLYEAGFKVNSIIMCGTEKQCNLEDESLMMPNIVVIAE